MMVRIHRVDPNTGAEILQDDAEHSLLDIFGGDPEESDFQRAEEYLAGCGRYYIGDSKHLFLLTRIDQ